MTQLSNFLKWTGHAAAWVEGVERAAGVEFMAGYRTGAMISLTRGATVLPAQLVALASARSQDSEVRGEAGRIARHDLTLIGVQNHLTLPDFDVRRGDRFTIGPTRYEITFVETALDGRIEAHATGME